MPNLDLSVCSLVLNEEKKLDNCLASVKNWAKEIIVVVDKNSTDKSEAVARKYTDKVWLKRHQANFHKNKQFALEQAQSNWILWLDGDEVVSDELKEEISKVLKRPQASGYRMKRKNIIFGKWIEHSGWYPDYQLRLFENGKASFPCKRIHEDIKVKGKIDDLSGHLIHYNYESVGQFIDKLNNYTSLDAENLSQELKGMSLIGPLLGRPMAEFIKRFLAQQGYKDGFHGLVLSLLQAFYELVVVIKVWQKGNFEEQEINLNKFEQQAKKLVTDWKWWRREINIKKTRSLKRWGQRVLRKLGR